MRRGWTLGAVFLLGLGILLSYVPIQAQSFASPRLTSSTEFVVDYASPFDLLFPRVAFTVSWNSTPYSTIVTIVGCGSDSSCAHPSSHPLAAGQGPFGNLSFFGQANRYYAILPQGGPVRVTVSYLTPLLGGAVGLGLLGGGGAALVWAVRPNRSRRIEPSEDLPPAESE